MATYTTDAVAVAFGVGITFYMLGCFVLWYRNRPVVVRHPYTKQWTAARSLRIEPPPTMEQNVSRLRITTRKHRQQYE